MIPLLKNDDTLINYLRRKKEALVLEEICYEIDNCSDKKCAKMVELAKVRDELQGMKAALCLPLLFEGKLIGILNLGKKLSEDIYSTLDIDLLMTLSNQLAIAIENAAISEEMLEAQRQLLLADKLAALGRVAAGMAHEIKNPLAAVKGMTQAIERDPNDAETIKDFREVVPKEIDRLNNLVENLTQLGRPPKLSFSQVDVNGIIERCLQLFEKRCSNHHIGIDKKLGLLPAIKADPEQLTQVLVNLILNAIQAMPNGGTLSVSSQPEETTIKLVIGDTGTGIPEDKMKNVFEPFFTTKEEGSGLGLAITYRIVKDHGGDIIITSEMGKGTLFVISFPRTDRKPQA